MLSLIGAFSGYFVPGKGYQARFPSVMGNNNEICKGNGTGGTEMYVNECQCSSSANKEIYHPQKTPTLSHDVICVRNVKMFTAR